MESEQNYSKRELDHYFDEIKFSLSKQNVVLARIEDQTTRTNGRVSRLEIWRTAIIWVMAVIFGFVSFLVPYAIKVVKKDLTETVRESSRQTVSELLKQYDVRVSKD